MALGKRLINTGAAAVCNTESVQAFGADSAFSSNIALYQLDGNANDTTGDYNGTASNVTYATGQFGNAGVFNGSSSYIDVSSLTYLFDSKATATVSLWFNTSTTATTSVLFSDYASSTARNFLVSINSTGNIVWNTRYGSGTGRDSNITTTSTYNDGNWHHIVLSIDQAANAKSMYVDGLQIGSSIALPTATGASFDSTQRVTIGSSYNTGTSAYQDYYNGSIDQVRLFNKAITPEEVSTLYNETTSTASNTNPLSDGSGVALYSLDYDASDAGGLYDGSPTDVDFGVDGQINYGARFNGSSSYIDVPSGVRQNNNFTFSFWFNTNSTTLGQNAVSFRDGKKFQIGLNNSNVGNGSIRVNAGNNTAVDSATGIFSANTWYHLAVTQSSTGGVKVYLNGSVIASNSGATGDLVSVTGRDVIGAYYSTSYIGFFNGKIDQVRMFSKALSSDEVDTLYAETACVYTSTTDIVNYPTGTTPIAYYKLDNSSEDYSTGGNDGTDTNIEYRFGRFGQAAVFNGSSSFIRVEDSSTNTFGFANHTGSISAWVNVDSFSNENNIVSKRETGNKGKRHWVLRILTSGKIDVLIYNTDDNSQQITTTSVINAKQWHHIAVTLTTTNVKIYIDGVLDKTASSTYSTIQDDGADLQIGRRGTNTGRNYFNGSIDQIRIYDAALTSSQVTELYNEKPEVDTSNFKTVLWEGDGADNRYISNLGIDLETSGGLVWTKTRTAAYYHQLQDSVRGAGANAIYSNSTDAENGGSSTYNADFGYINSFEANGWFTKNGSDGLGTWVNRSGNDYVAWVWKGGGDAVPNEVGDLTTQVSANTEAGFSIATYTGSYTGGDTTKSIGHGLNFKPDIFIVKNRTRAKDWYVYTDIIDGSMDFLYLNRTDAKGDSSRAVSTDNVNYIGGASTNNIIGDEYVVYSFHSVSGYSSIGSYSGTGSSGNAITGLGFQPNWLMVKRTEASGNSWIIFDHRRVESDGDQSALAADTTTAEFDYDVDFTSDGFTLNTTTTNANASGTNNYIYIAFK